MIALLLCALTAFAATVSPKEIAASLQSAKTTQDYATVVHSSDQATYLLGLIAGGEIARSLVADSITSDKNTLTLKGSWGKITFDVSKSSPSKVVINGKPFKIKNNKLIKLDDLAINNSPTDENFFRTVGASLITSP